MILFTSIRFYRAYKNKEHKGVYDFGWMIIVLASGAVFMPHVVIDMLSTGLGALLDHYTATAHKPLIWLTHPTSADRSCRESLRQYETAYIDPHLLLYKNTNSKGRTLQDCIREARAENKLSPGEPLRIALHGTHSRSCTFLGMPPEKADDDGHLIPPPNMEPFKKNRRLFSEVYKVLMSESCPEAPIKPIWLKDRFSGDIGHRALPAGERTLQKLVQHVRTELDIKAKKSPDLLISRPVLFQRQTPVQASDRRLTAWRKWKPLSGKPQPNTVLGILKLLRDDEESSGKEKTAPGSDFVLLKLFHKDLKFHNPLDTPLLTHETQIALASEDIKINKVIWDKRVGIIAPPQNNAVSRRRPNIYFA